MRQQQHLIRVVAVVFGLLLAAPVFAGEGSGEGHEGSHHETCESVAELRLNLFDLFDWKEKNEAECKKWESDKSHKPVRVGPPILAALANFAILAFLFVRMGKKPFASFLQTRHETIKKQLEESAARWKEAQERLALYEQKLQQMAQERKQLEEQYKEFAQKEIQQLQQDTEKQIAKLKTDAERDVQVAIFQAERSIRREVVEQAVAAAEKILSKEITTEDRTRMFSHLLQRFQNQNDSFGGAA